MSKVLLQSKADYFLEWVIKWSKWSMIVLGLTAERDFQTTYVKILCLKAGEVWSWKLPNHQYDDQEPTRPKPSSELDLQVAGLQVYAASPISLSVKYFDTILIGLF